MNTASALLHAISMTAASGPSETPPARVYDLIYPRKSTVAAPIVICEDSSEESSCSMDLDSSSDEASSFDLDARYCDSAALGNGEFMWIEGSFQEVRRQLAHEADPDYMDFKMDPEEAAHDQWIDEEDSELDDYSEGELETVGEAFEDNYYRKGHKMLCH